MLRRSNLAGIATFGIPVFGGARQEAINQGLDPVSSIIHGVRQTASETITEAMSFGPMMKLIKGKGQLVSLMGSFFGRELFGEEINTLASDFESWMNMPENVDKSFAEFASEVPSHALDTLLAVVGGGGTTMTVGAGIGAIYNRQVEASQAKARKEVMDSVVLSAEESELRTNSPETYKQLLKSYQENPDAEVHIPADDANTFFQSNPEELEALQENDPALFQRVQSALATGSDISMPFADIVTDHLEWVKGMGDSMRYDNDTLSFKEAEEQDIEIKQTIQDMSDKIIEDSDAPFRDSSQKVHDMYKQGMIESMRYTSDVAETNATLFSSFMNVVASEQGIMPEDAANQYMLGQVGLRGKAFTPSKYEADYFDDLVHRIRSGRTPTDTEVFGESLLNFLNKKGGLLESGGELKMRDIKPKKGGMDLDEAARIAQEAGYIQERDINELLEAIDRDQGDAPAYSTTAMDSDLESVRRDVTGLQEQLTALGITDITDLSNEALRGLLEAQLYQTQLKAAAQESGYEGDSAGESAEWLAAEAKGLDMSLEARMARAVEMGFDIENVLYHGTEAQFTEFDKKFIEGKISEGGFFFTAAKSTAAMGGGSKAILFEHTEAIYCYAN